MKGSQGSCIVCGVCQLHQCHVMSTYKYVWLSKPFLEQVRSNIITAPIQWQVFDNVQGGSCQTALPIHHVFCICEGLVCCLSHRQAVFFFLSSFVLHSTSCFFLYFCMRYSGKRIIILLIVVFCMCFRYIDFDVCWLYRYILCITIAGHSIAETY